VKVTLPVKRVPGRWERLAEEREERDRETAKDRGFVFDAEEGERIVAFSAKYLKHTKGEWAGKPFELAPWQATNLRRIFGWKREDGSRRFRGVWWEVPRKNGKTHVAGLAGIYCFVGDREHGAEVYWTATKRDQALYGHELCEAMVKASPDLKRFVKVGRWTMSCATLNSKMAPLTADQDTADGLSPSCDLRDEVHEWKDHRLAAKLDTAAGARRQPLRFEITTAGVYDKDGVGWSHHEYATRVLEGVTANDSLYAYIASADEGDDPFDPATWWKANPNLGVSPKLDYIAQLAEDVKTGKLAINDFLRFHLNVWTRQAKRWLDILAWNECDSSPVVPDPGAPCWGGLDLSTSSREGITAWVLVWPRDDGGIDVLPRFWIPEERLKGLVRQGQVQFAEWVRIGALRVIPGAIIEFGYIQKQILEDAETYNLRELCYDGWEASKLVQDLDSAGMNRVVKIPQTIQHLSEPSKALEALILGRKVHHGGHPVLTAHVDAAECRMDANGNIAPNKTAQRSYIDGVVAMITALARAQIGEQSDRSYLDGDGAEVLLA